MYESVGYQVVLRREGDGVMAEGLLRPFHLDEGWGGNDPVKRRKTVDSTSIGPGRQVESATLGRLNEVGTPYCVTVDVKTVGDTEKGEVGDGKVTIRGRDSMEQIRVPIDALDGVLARLLDEGAAWETVARDFPRADG